MDKRTLIGIILIILITMLMPYYQRLIMGDRPLPEQRRAQDTTQAADTAAFTHAETEMAPQFAGEIEPHAETVPKDITAIGQDTIYREIRVENKYLIAVLSNDKGGNPVHWELKHYKYYLGGNVNLIRNNGLELEFTNRDGKVISLSDYRAFVRFPDNDNIVLDDKNPTAEVEFYLPVAGGKIVKKMIFYYDRYSVDVVVYFEGLQNYVINRRYLFSWEKGLPPTEENIRDDLSFSRAYVYMAGELEDLDVSKVEEKQVDFNGRVNWTAVRNKYFLISLIPSNPDQTYGAMLKASGVDDGGILYKHFSCTIDMPYTPEQSVRDTFTVYLGPLDYDVLKKYEVDLQILVMNKDWYERLFRPISLLILPAFKLLHSVIPNYGLVIIIFSILIKLILHPLTKKSYQSMSEMQYIQPLIVEIREKYKNDPQRMNKELMRIYKEHGINPLGGCLPTLLQMPLLFALFIVFRSTIQLRDQPFVLWITDLSNPDKLYLGVNLPLIGDSIHVLPIIMAITMIWQSRMTITDPKQKFLVYIMPVFMLFIFYSLPSGLNLYYTIFNVLSMIQTNMIKKKMHPNGQPAKPVAKATSPAAKGKRKTEPKSRKRTKK